MSVSSPVRVSSADIPRDLAKIRECRSTETPVDRPLLNAQRGFLNADAVASKAVTCLIVQELWFPFRVLGTADVRLRSNGAYVNNVMIRREARGRGLGELLMTSVEGLVDANQVIELEVDTSNKVALSLYRKLGYRPPGIHAVSCFLGESLGLPLKILLQLKTQ